MKYLLVIGLVFLGVQPLAEAKKRVKYGLPRGAVKAGIKSRTKEIRGCYETERRQKPELAGEVKVMLKIDSEGTVSQSRVQSSSLEGCLLSVLKTLTFPKPEGGGIVDVSYPFTFGNPAAVKKQM